MAKKTKKAKRTTRRRRSHVGGLAGAINVTNILAVVAGAVGAGMLNKVVPATVNDKVVAGGKIALGVALPMFSKGGKMKEILSGVGAGMIAVGAVDALKSFGVLSGDFDIPVLNGDVLTGDDLDVINGLEDEDAVNGAESDYLLNGPDDDELHGYDED